MNGKMTTNAQLSTTKPKNKNKNNLSKQLEQEQNHRNRDRMEGYQWGGGNRGRGTGNKQHKWQVQNRQGNVKNSIRNVEAKKLTCMIHGHELSGMGMQVGRGVQGRGK